MQDASVNPRETGVSKLPPQPAFLVKALLVGGNAGVCSERQAAIHREMASSRQNLYHPVSAPKNEGVRPRNASKPSHLA